MKFKNLQRCEIKKGATAWLHMQELGEDARLLLRPTMQANSDWLNAVLLTAKGDRTAKKKSGVDISAIAKQRLQNKKIFPKCIIVDWEGVENGEDGEEFIEFSTENAVELCKALPDHLFDEITAFAGTPEYFYADDELPPDAVELGKNS